MCTEYMYHVYKVIRKPNTYTRTVKKPLERPNILHQESGLSRGVVSWQG